MYFLITARVVRYAVGFDPADHYAARQNSFHSLTWSGPFTTRAAAEQSAAAALSVQTCLSAHVYHRNELVFESQHAPNPNLRTVAADALRFNGTM